MNASLEPPTLSDEHALLLREVTSRAEAVLREADEDRWPERQLRALVDYLHLEVLQQVVDEEWLVFRLAHHAADELARLRREHLELRQAIDALAQAATTEGMMSAEQLAACTRDLLAQLRDHLAAEDRILVMAGAATPPTTTFGARPHEWYALTAGPVIDLDRLPGAAGIDAVLDRMLRLTPGEEVELRASSDPGPIWRRLTSADPGGYGCTVLQQDAGHWRMQIRRRAS